MSQTEPVPEELSFEDGLSRLEAVLSQLESDEMTLEDMLSLYEQGQSLVDLCTKLLTDAELRIKTLEEGRSE